MSRVTRRKVITKRSSGPPQSTGRITRRSAQGKADAATQRKAIRRGSRSLVKSGPSAKLRSPSQKANLQNQMEAANKRSRASVKNPVIPKSPVRDTAEAKAKRAKLKGLLSTRKKMPTRDELARGSKANIRRSLSLKKIMGR